MPSFMFSDLYDGVSDGCPPVANVWYVRYLLGFFGGQVHL